jgi:hypothetical protein
MSTLIPPWNLRSSSDYFPDGLPSPTVLSFEVNEQNHSNEDQVHMHIDPRRLKSYEEERAGLVASILRVPAPGGRFDPGLRLLGNGEWICQLGNYPETGSEKSTD